MNSLGEIKKEILTNVLIFPFDIVTLIVNYAELRSKQSFPMPPMSQICTRLLHISYLGTISELAIFLPIVTSAANAYKMKNFTKSIIDNLPWSIDLVYYESKNSIVAKLRRKAPIFICYEYILYAKVNRLYVAESLKDIYEHGLSLFDVYHGITRT
jgi:hypothetical protein